MAVSAELYFDYNSYLRYGAGRYVLTGAETRLSFRFRYCSVAGGLLIYQDGLNGYFSLGVNSRNIYLEWKTSNNLIEVIS